MAGFTKLLLKSWEYIPWAYILNQQSLLVAVFTKEKKFNITPCDSTEVSNMLEFGYFTF